MTDMDREIGRLIAGQENMQKAIASLALSVKSISDTQQTILEIQAKHSSNAELIEKNAKAISAVHRRVDPLEIDVDRNTRFRQGLVKAMWYAAAPILAGSGIAGIIWLATHAKV